MTIHAEVGICLSRPAEVLFQCIALLQTAINSVWI
jgi:hypothetical protein